VGWSPDGKQMAFIRGGPAEVGRTLVITDADGGNEKVLGTRKGRAGFADAMPGGTTWSPAWSPDGDHVAVLQRLSEDVTDIGIDVFDVDGGDPRVLSIRGDVPMGVGWLDNETLVVPQALEQGTPSQLWQISYPEGRRSRLSNDINRYVDVSISADGNALVTSRPDARVAIWVGDAKGVGREVLRPTTFLSAAMGFATVGWDGKDVLFTHTLNGKFEIFRISVDGDGSAQPIVAGRDMAVAPDGTILYRTLTGNDVGLWKVDRDGRRPVQLAPGSISFPMATWDSQQAIYSSSIGGYQTLWRVPLAGGAPTQVLDTNLGISAYSDVSPDGKSIVLVRDRQWNICDFPACRECAPTNISGGLVRWMPDGKALSYVGQNQNLWLYPLDGSSPRTITNFTDRLLVSYAWSRDGRLVVARGGNTSDIVLFKGLRATK
jgi:Tol biopolymer transport system component